MNGGHRRCEGKCEQRGSQEVSVMKESGWQEVTAMVGSVNGDHEV